MSLCLSSCFSEFVSLCFFIFTFCLFALFCLFCFVSSVCGHFVVICLRVSVFSAHVLIISFLGNTDSTKVTFSPVIYTPFSTCPCYNPDTSLGHNKSFPHHGPTAEQEAKFAPFKAAAIAQLNGGDRALAEVKRAVRDALKFAWERLHPGLAYPEPWMNADPFASASGGGGSGGGGGNTTSAESNAKVSHPLAVSLGGAGQAALLEGLAQEAFLELSAFIGTCPGALLFFLFLFFPIPPFFKLYFVFFACKPRHFFLRACAHE